MEEISSFTPMSAVKTLPSVIGIVLSETAITAVVRADPVVEADAGVRVGRIVAGTAVGRDDGAGNGGVDLLKSVLEHPVDEPVDGRDPALGDRKSGIAQDP